jgi:two-component system chemotaxis response regulator CheY
MARVMIAEDSQFVRMRLSKLLVAHDYQVVEAQNGEEAVQVYHKLKPDVVLMDIAMPIKNGMWALSQIRRFDPQARIIMLTALNQEAIVLRAMQAGAKDFLTKPYESAQVLRTLQKALE